MGIGSLSKKYKAKWQTGFITKQSILQKGGYKYDQKTYLP